jgi:trimeric autotransporter adhesin
MRQAAMRRASAAGVCFGRMPCCMAASSGDPNPGNTRLLQPLLRAAAPSRPGGKLHGVVKSGNIPLPGVTVTAQNTLTGKRYSTTTDITGAWQMNIPQNGRYVIRTQFAAFAEARRKPS